MPNLQILPFISLDDVSLNIDGTFLHVTTRNPPPEYPCYLASTVPAGDRVPFSLPWRPRVPRAFARLPWRKAAGAKQRQAHKRSPSKACSGCTTLFQHHRHGGEWPLLVLKEPRPSYDRLDRTAHLTTIAGGEINGSLVSMDCSQQDRRFVDAVVLPLCCDTDDRDDGGSCRQPSR